MYGLRSISVCPCESIFLSSHAVVDAGALLQCVYCVPFRRVYIRAVCCLCYRLCCVWAKLSRSCLLLLCCARLTDCLPACWRKEPCVRVSVILSKRLFYMVNNISADSVGVCQSLGTNAFSLEIIFPCRHAITTFVKLSFVRFFINQKIQIFRRNLPEKKEIRSPSELTEFYLRLAHFVQFFTWKW